MEIRFPHATMSVRRVYWEKGKESSSEVQEGELQMSQEQQDQYKAVIGDGLGRVSVGRDMSEMDYGSGGKVFISVSLVCDQSAAGVQYAAALAAQAADYLIEQHYQQMKARCVAMGLLEPPQPQPGRPQY